MVASVRKERRTGLDRRQFAYDLHIPERRGPRDRRRATETDEQIRSPDLSNELVAQLISDSFLFHAEDETETQTLGDHAE